MATWEKRIDKAEERGYFTTKDNEDAGSWMSCAVGEGTKRHNMNPFYLIAFDEQISKAGIDFTNAVDKDDFDRARKDLARIQTRMSKLDIGGYAEFATSSPKRPNYVPETVGYPHDN